MIWVQNKSWKTLWWGRKVEFFSCGQCSSVEAVVHIDKKSYYFGCCLKENEKISTSDLFRSWTVCTNVQTMYTLRSLVFKSPAMSIICSTLMEVSWKKIARQEGSSLHAICDSNFLFFLYSNGHTTMVAALSTFQLFYGLVIQNFSNEEEVQAILKGCYKRYSHMWSVLNLFLNICSTISSLHSIRANIHLKRRRYLKKQNRKSSTPMAWCALPSLLQNLKRKGPKEPSLTVIREKNNNDKR